ncbi:MAG: serine/threonine-protein kinase [Nostoc sp.]|uniref:serine/threonine-protein kinase n=1 Tax=Nostoc sp. TaxID=1180 RepID=UPI002FF5E43C
MKLWTLNQNLDNGRFIIQKVLGGGGYGVTYSAIEQLTGKVVVIKTLNHIQQSKEDFQQRQVKFVNEALRLARCTHTHIVQVYEVIQEDGLWGMVMEYIDGEDLGAYVEQHGQLSEDEALRFIDQVGQALEYVHKQGFLHRDIKPNNIILRGGKSEAVLIDFGLAREFTVGKVGSMTNERTNGYAPIEQYERQGVFGHYTDVYALAATLYSLLTKEVPFPANFRDKGIPLPPPKQFNPQISDRVNDAIMKAMALQPQERLQSVLEFRELLGSASIQPHQQEGQQLIANIKGLELQSQEFPQLVSPKQLPGIDKEESEETILLVSPKQLNPQISDRLKDGILKNIALQFKKSLQSVSESREKLSEIKLISAVNIDYTRLQDLLAAGEWKEANEEATRVMLAVPKREKEGWFRPQDIDNFPYEDIQTINKLWVKYSNGRFGFSIQKRIHQSMGGTRNYDKKIWEAFADRVGWKKDGEWILYSRHLCTWNLNAPYGHLPLPHHGFMWGCGCFLSHKDL